jgi:alginate O-acetyltransferase complex protein AlgI
MSGHTIGIIAGWLVLACLLGWSLPARWQRHAIAVCGAGLLGTMSVFALVFVAGGTAASVAVARSRLRRRLVPAFVVTVAAVYLTFLILASWGDRLGEGHWLVPFGMAYSTLRLVHYVLDADRGVLPRHRWFDVVSYQFFPPVLAVGPINRFAPYHRETRVRAWDPELFSAGLSRVLIGATKIVVLGNYLVSDVMSVGISHFPAGAAWYLRQLQFWLSLYVQFSGYTDVALGTGAALGVKLPENFNFPWLARNIGDFWRRWHVTLADWCRDYVYMPLFARWRSAALATSGAMLTLGLWHQASLHYVLWGLYHATGLTVWRAFQRRTRALYDSCSQAARGAWDGLAWLLTIHFVVMSYTVTTWIEKAALGK